MALALAVGKSLALPRAGHRHRHRHRQCPGHGINRRVACALPIQRALYICDNCHTDRDIGRPPPPSPLQCRTSRRQS